MLTEDERTALVDDVVGHIEGGVTDEIPPRVIDYWTRVDSDLGQRVAKGVAG